jgi:hypothetical protein
VGPFGAALLIVHDALKEGAEETGRDAAPVEAAAGEERGALGGRQVGAIEPLSEEAAVDVEEGGVIGGKMRGAGWAGRVEHLEKFGEAVAKIGAVFLEPSTKRVKEFHRNMSVSSAKRQKRTRTRKRSRRWPE